MVDLSSTGGVTDRCSMDEDTLTSGPSCPPSGQSKLLGMSNPGQHCSAVDSCVKDEVKGLEGVVEMQCVAKSMQQVDEMQLEEGEIASFQEMPSEMLEEEKEEGCQDWASVGGDPGKDGKFSGDVK
jgi:hypothetical protein